MLETELCGLDLDPPVLLASGVLGTTGSSLRRVADRGAGGVVTKSLGLEPKEGHPGPNVCEVRGGVLNSMGLPNPGLDAFSDEMETAKEGDAPVIVSVYASSADDFAAAAAKAEDIGGDAVELNLSCPHAEGYGAAVGSDPEVVRKVVASAAGATDVPVLAKLTPNVADVAAIGRAAERGGADGLVAINTLGPGMAIDVETKRPILGNGRGGLSGPAVHPVAVRCVHDLYDATDIPVVGVGGVRDAETAIQMVLAGATAVQVGTATRRDTSRFASIAEGMRRYLERHGHGHIAEIRGAAHG